MTEKGTEMDDVQKQRGEFTRQVSVLLTPEQYERFRRAAFDAGRKMSEIARSLIEEWSRKQG